MRLEQALKDEAARQGFSLAGITTPGPPEHLAAFEKWLGAGMHGEMAYLESERARQRRADPRLLLAECDAILVLGIPYYPSKQGRGERGSLPDRRDAEMVQGQPEPLSPAPYPLVGQARGRVAAYAWGEDYHHVIPERMRLLVDFLEGYLGRTVPHRWYTDSGPLLERDLAQRAGLGWIGKNTCLINPLRGSYFFLAELLLGVSLQPDPPFTEDRCGACTRCIDACPTGCIRPDRTLDARRCISYLTIELKGEIPEELRPLLGDWVFGCDVCQQVCPWNRFALAQGAPAFAPHPEIAQPDLIAELALKMEEFKRKFEGSPVLRAKRRGYLRNVAVALGNQDDAGVISALERAAGDEDELVRVHAAWAVRRIKGGS